MDVLVHQLGVEYPVTDIEEDVLDKQTEQYLHHEVFVTWNFIRDVVVKRKIKKEANA